MVRRRLTKCLCLVKVAPGIVMVLGILACAHNYRVVPAPEAASGPGPGQAAMGENAGVKVTVGAQAWNGDPPNLTDSFLPLWVEIENHSGKPVWVRYNTIHLDGTGGSTVTLKAIPPFKVQGKAVMSVPPVRPDYRPTGFYTAPYLGPSYTGFADPWQGPEMSMDSDYYMSQDQYWEENLPTADMLRRGLPEGVITEGGKIGGFVYFPKFKGGASRLLFHDELVDANTRQPFGVVEIPFVAVKS